MSIHGIDPGDARSAETEALARLIAGAIPEPVPPRPEHRAELRERLLSRQAGTAAGEPIRFTVCEAAPLGRVFLGYTEKGICFITSAPGDEVEFVEQVRARYNCDAIRDDSRRARWQAALERWLAGRSPAVPLDLSRVTPWERTVLEKAREIHRGAVRPYQWLAREVGKPGASRAIGNVMARNPVPLFIPCHRVVAASGVIGNYSMGGPAVKRQLLELEGVDVERLHQLASRGYRYKASKTTGIYCYPTCREIQPQHEVLFRTPEEAEAAGFRPCKICRPG